MIYIILKTIITAIVVVAVSEIAKKSSLIAAIIVSLPLTSLLAFIWLYLDTKNVDKVADLSFSTLIMVIPSFTFFIVLPVMIKFKYSFTISITTSIIVTTIAYYVFINLLKKYGLGL